MDLFEALYSRRAVRSFTDEAVDEPTITKLIDAAIHAPSAMNQQPWSFIVIRDRHLMERISAESKRTLLRTSPLGLAPHHFQDLLADQNFEIFYNAPALVVIAGPTDNPWTVADCSLAAENFMLAACALGLGTCWIGFAQAWLATNEGKAAIGLDNALTAVAPIIVGHPKAHPPGTPRRGPEVSWING